MQHKLSCGHYYGEVMQSRQVGGLILTETRYAPGVRLPKHSHEHAYFCLVRRGSYTEAYGSKSRACGPLTFVFHPPEEEHSEAFDDSEAWSFNIEVMPRWLEQVRSRSAVLDRAVDFQGGAIAGLAMRLYREFIHMDDVAPLAIEGLTLEILAEVSRSATKPCGRQPPRWLQRMKEIVHAEFAAPLTMERLAKLVGMHPVHAASEFRRHYECTVGDYVRQRRVDFSCGRLTGSRNPLAEIALEAGFADQSHFTRIFKQYMGITPAAYRRMARI